MRHTGRTMLAALIVVFALGAVASASALAAPPEFTLKHSEKFPLTIESKLHAGTVTLETSTIFHISCSENKSTGEATAAKAVSLTLELTGCSQKGETFHSEGAPAGHIVIPGSGTLVYINEAKEQVGILFTLKEVKIEASGGTKLSLSGSLVIPITPINTETFTLNLPIHQSGVGKQEFHTYENESREVENTKLEMTLGGGYEAASIEMAGSNEVKTDKEVTVATSVTPPIYLSAFGSEGTGAGQFYYPEMAAVAGGGNVWVSDTSNNRLEELSSSGTFVEAIGWGVSNGKSEFEICKSSCQAGIPGAGNGQFNHPRGLAVAATSGKVYVADSANERVQEFSVEGEYLGQWGGEGNKEGQFGHKSPLGWEGPEGVAIAPSGNVYVTGSGENNDRIQEFKPEGKFIRQWGSPSEFSFVHGIAVAANGDVYIAEGGYSHILEFSAEGKLITKWGSAGKENGQLYCPHGIAVDASGNVYVADECNDRIQEFSATGIFTTKWGSPGSKEGQFNSPADVAIAPNGNVYVVDSANDRIQKFE